MTANLDRPGLPDYTGPESGGFFAVHHDAAVEWSDYIGERVIQIRAHKRDNEIPVRLYNLLYLPFVTKEWVREYDRRCVALLDKYTRECGPFWAEYHRQHALLDAPILDYVRQHIPDHAWKDGRLQFPEEKITIEQSEGK